MEINQGNLLQGQGKVGDVFPSFVSVGSPDYHAYDYVKKCNRLQTITITPTLAVI